jgi:hypothetical protein
MTIQEALGRYIPTITGLSALVSARVYWIAGPSESGLPAVTFRRTASPRLASFLKGASQIPKYTIEVTAYSKISPDQAQSIAEVISAGLDGYKGLMGSGSPFVGLSVKGCWLTDETDLPYDDFGLFAVQQTYEIIT